VDPRRLAPITSAVTACGRVVETMTRARSSDAKVTEAVAIAIRIHCDRSSGVYGPALRQLQGEARRTGASRLADAVESLVEGLIIDHQRAGQEAFEQALERCGVSAASE